MKRILELFKQWIFRVTMIKFYPYKWNSNPVLFECSNCKCKTITQHDIYCHICGVKLKWYNG